MSTLKTLTRSKRNEMLKESGKKTGYQSGLILASLVCHHYEKRSKISFEINTILKLQKFFFDYEKFCKKANQSRINKKANKIFGSSRISDFDIAESYGLEYLLKAIADSLR